MQEAAILFFCHLFSQLSSSKNQSWCLPLSLWPPTPCSAAPTTLAWWSQHRELFLPPKSQRSSSKRRASRGSTKDWGRHWWGKILILRWGGTRAAWYWGGKKKLTLQCVCHSRWRSSLLQSPSGRKTSYYFLSSSLFSALWPLTKKCFSYGPPYKQIARYLIGQHHPVLSAHISLALVNIYQVNPNVHLENISTCLSLHVLQCDYCSCTQYVKQP